MILPGLVSITFRQLTAPDVIKLVVEAKLQVIEWGGDIHVPHGDVQQARQVAQWTADAGLAVAAYGSYYRLATPEQTDFERVLETAVALGAPIIRVWAGRIGSADADEAHKQNIYKEVYQIAALAQGVNINISLEFHDYTLTDTTQSALDLIHAVQHDNLSMYWQPPHRISEQERMNSLLDLMPYLTNVHVFQWHHNHPNPSIRYPLSKGTVIWQTYFQQLNQSDRDHAAMIEFVRDDEPKQFLADAKTLLSWFD